MPTAGAIIPPTITPVRPYIPGQPQYVVDTDTYIELKTDSPGCKIYFTTDGSKPLPFKTKYGGRHVTHKYKAPFQLHKGKREIKTIAVTRDGMRESPVNVRTLFVDPSPNNNNEVDIEYDLDDETVSLDGDDYEIALPQPKRSSKDPPLSASRKRDAWAPNNASWPPPASPRPEDDSRIPTNYSGTQINVWGPLPTSWSGFSTNEKGGVTFAPSTPRPLTPTTPTTPITPSNVNSIAPPYIPATGSGIGSETEKMLRRLEETRDMTLTEIRRVIEELHREKQEQQQEQQRLQQQQQRQQQFQPQRLSNVSPGNGNWKDQSNHIVKQLNQFATQNPDFRVALAEPRLGKLVDADLEDSEDGFLVFLNFENPDAMRNNNNNNNRNRRPAPVKASRPRSTTPTKVTPRPTVTFEGDEEVMEEEEEEPSPPPTPQPQPPKKKQPEPPPAKKKPQQPEKKKERAPEYEDPTEYSGTIDAADDFDPDSDAEALRKAMKGLGTDEDAIMDILPYRSNEQRQEILAQFKQMFGKDLKKELEGELSGKLRQTVLALLETPANYSAAELRKAMKGAGTDETALIEILCTSTNEQIEDIKAAYQKLFNRNLEEDVADDTSGHFKRLLVSILQGKRSESLEIDREKAKTDAKALHDAGEKSWGTDESRFNTVLASRSPSQLRLTFVEYAKIAKKDIEDSIKSEMSGDLKKSMLAVVRSVKNRAAFFAAALQRSMKGLGTSDDELIRILVSRSEIDLTQIKDAFEENFKGSLGSWIADDTSGDYKTLLLAILREEAKGKK